MRLIDIKGGLAHQKGVTKKDVDPKEFAIGLNVEKEHSSDPHRIEQTVLDHLAEDPKYYTKLKGAHLEERNLPVDDNWVFHNITSKTNRPETQIELVMNHFNVDREDAEEILYNYKRKGYEAMKLYEEPKYTRVFKFQKLVHPDLLRHALKEFVKMLPAEAEAEINLPFDLFTIGNWHAVPKELQVKFENEIRPLYLYNQGEKMSNSNDKQELQKEAFHLLLKKMIKENVMSYYEKTGREYIKKNEKLKKPEKERMAEDEGYGGDTEASEKKQEFVHELLELTHKYNTCKKMTKEDLIDELAEVGKMINAKKDTIKKNMENFKTGRKVYVYEMAQMMLEEADDKSAHLEDHIPESKEKNKDFWAKDVNKDFKKAPEHEKELSEDDSEEGFEEKDTTKKTSDTMGKSEAAKGDPKGVKKMKEDKPTKFKSFLTGKNNVSY